MQKYLDDWFAVLMWPAILLVNKKNAPLSRFALRSLPAGLSYDVTSRAAEKLQPWPPLPDAAGMAVSDVSPQLCVPVFHVIPAGQLWAATGSVGAGVVVSCACAATGSMAIASMIRRMSSSSVDYASTIGQIAQITNVPERRTL